MPLIIRDTPVHDLTGLGALSPGLVTAALISPPEVSQELRCGRVEALVLPPERFSFFIVSRDLPEPSGRCVRRRRVGAAA